MDYSIHHGLLLMYTICCFKGQNESFGTRWKVGDDAGNKNNRSVFHLVNGAALKHDVNFDDNLFVFGLVCDSQKATTKVDVVIPGGLND
jgi:hypothetical protein